MPLNNTKPLTVLQVNNYIKQMFASDYMLKSVRVSGEISNIKYHTTGHVYFTLKDESSAIDCVMFSSYAAKLKTRFQNGDKVVAAGSVSVYEKAGRYQIYVTGMEKAGLGDLYEQFERLKQKLNAEGLFDKSHKKAIPEFAQTIGIVTASTGAAVRDIVNVSRRRNPYVQLILYPALVQGEFAAESIAEGIRALDAIGVDVMIVGRGGGSIEDLWAFNEEIVARAIYECDTPVISAVGHETDTTIADFVSDLRAPTPSAAAELAVFRLKDVLDRLAGYKDSLYEAVMDDVDDLRNRLKHFEAGLRIHHPGYILSGQRQELLSISDKLMFVLNTKYERYTRRLENYAHRLDKKSPLKRISGGYGYVMTNDGKPLLSVENVSTGDDISIYLRDGKLRAQVTDTEHTGDISRQLEKKNED
ncbi:MAG: exodeoxyribonuclease VII large subunit [Lachnospiraceae bacterium]|nr:exodeoxyribonuclease VII large subunit [Lachnospiraceae bacterium]